MGLSYNGFEIGSWVKTESVQVIPQYDESGADHLYNLLRISVTAILNAGVAPALDWGLGVQAAAAKVRDVLSVPRRTLVYSVGGAEVLRVDRTRNQFAQPLNQFVDDELGPKVHCETTVVTPGTFTLRFTVETRVRECADGEFPLDPISVRWEMSDTVDENWFRTRRTTGTLISSGRLLRHPDDQANRLTVTPDIPPGFRRVREHFTVDPTGLKMRFEFEDKQLARTPPVPGTRMFGKQTEAVEANSQMRYGTVHIRLEGPPVPKTNDQLNETLHVKSLLNAAAAVAAARMEASNPFAPKDGRVMLGGEFGESLDDTGFAVECALRWMIRPPQKGQPAGRIGAGWVGTPIPGARNAAGVPGRIAPPARGVPTPGSVFADVALFAAKLRDPCTGPRGGRSDTRRHEAPVPAPLDPPPDSLPGPQRSLFPVPGGFSDGLLTVVVGEVADPLTTVVNDPDPGIYTVYRCEIREAADPGVIVLPVTDDSGDNVKVRTHSPMLAVTVEWVASKYGEPPEVPGPQTSDPNLVFVGGTHGMPHVEPGPDGTTPRYCLAGVYEYQILSPKKWNARAPSAPYLDASWAADRGKMAWTNFGPSPLDPPAGGSLSDGGGNPFDPGTGPGGSSGGPTVGA